MIAHAACSPRRAERGQTLALLLLAAIPLASLLMAVSRFGPAVRDRMELQTAADAAALAGATWSARACNLLAQVHQSEAQMASGIALLRAVEPTRVRAEAALAALEASGAVPAVPIAAERQLLRDWEAGLAGLKPLADPANPEGLWAAVETLESLRGVFLQSVPSLAAEEAEALGRANGAEAVVFWPSPAQLPVVPGVPADLREAAGGWLAMGARRLTAAWRVPLLSDARTLFDQEARAALEVLLADAAFPARPAVWRREARRGLDGVAFAWRGGPEGRDLLTVAQARPVNPVRGDLATARWSARLVPAERAAQALSEAALPSRRGMQAAWPRLTAAALDELNCH